jgi:hypothetical protein
MSPSVLPPERPGGRTLPGESAPSTPSKTPLTPSSSSAASGNKIRPTAVSGEASELIIPDNEGFNWFLQTLEKVATVQAEHYQNEIFKEYVDTRSANQLPAGAAKPDRFCHLDEAKQQAIIDHFFAQDILQLVDLYEKYPKGVYDLDVEDGPYEAKMGLSGTEINATRTQLLNNDIQIAMAKGDGRMESQETSSRLSRVSATGNFMDSEPQKFKAGLIFGTALANERDERISAMLPDKLNTFLDTLDTIFAPNKQPYTPWPVGTDQRKEGTRADGTKFKYKSAMGKRAKFDDCGMGPSEVDKSLDTFYDTIEGNSFYQTIKANPTDASRLATSQRESFGRRLAPGFGFSSPDSNISDHQSSDANSLPASEMSNNSIPDGSTRRPRVTFADETSDSRTASDGRSRRRSTRTSKL